MLIIANAPKNIAIVSVITQVLFVVLGILATIAAVRMTNALNRKAEDFARGQPLSGSAMCAFAMESIRFAKSKSAAVSLWPASCVVMANRSRSHRRSMSA